MLPVLVFLLLATTQGYFVLAEKVASAADLHTSKIRVPRSPGGFLSQNQSIPDDATTAESPNNNNNFEEGCKRCGVKLPPVKGTSEYELRIAMIKRQILDKLNMIEEPKIQRSKREIPQSLVNAKFLETPLVKEDEKVQESKLAQVILTGTKVNSSSSRNLVRMSRKMKFEFYFSNKIYNNAITGAKLWVFRRNTHIYQLLNIKQTLKVTDYEPNNSEGRMKTQYAIKKRLTSKDQGWVSIDVKTMVDMWIKRTFMNKSLNHSNIIHTMEISCPECLSSGEPFRNPYIVLDLSKSKGSSRKKRSINCRSGMKECCRQVFYVSFRDIGWHNWIMAPLGFNANYCTGSCYGHILPVHHHTDILQKVSMLNERRDIAPCCSPTKFFGLSLIYFDQDENLFHENVPRMVVDECGCS